MDVLSQKKLLVERILPRIADAPPDAAQQLLRKEITELEKILGDAITAKTKADVAAEAQREIEQMRDESKREHAFTHACLAIINNRRLSSCESNQQVLESLLNPGEEPSSKLYIALAEQYPQRFAWEPVRAKPTNEENRAEFDRYVRENNLSACEANFALFTQGEHCRTSRGPHK
jgi:DNA primase